ncbi:hypothetical protein CCM_08867 [Cordyceps militaris CM01]|uniref:Uncharacterized protein n=2 Tax=Cordyceps militaris TaxID=73501 RepID=G3JSC2_CORMM|nr:uncharacterized protein CCM_08867 [Cordyceps militaris CM01]ATY62079.1 hypothetical protein A9K55_009114 [Cordyceps militaris]EGX88821.1 hypothetical protein CCM_08867 [Cordyceps militaris CM01]
MSSAAGPARAMRPATAAAASSSAAAAAHKTPDKGSSFTAEMRDRQARGKDPYTKDHDEEEEEEEEEEDDDMDIDEEEEEEDDDDDGVEMQIGNVPKNETFEERQSRQFALAVLDSPEQLMMYAQSTNDGRWQSIPGQRYRFMTTLCGFSGEEGSVPAAQQQQPARTARRR